MPADGKAIIMFCPPGMYTTFLLLDKVSAISLEASILFTSIAPDPADLSAYKNSVFVCVRVRVRVCVCV